MSRHLRCGASVLFAALACLAAPACAKSVGPGNDGGSGNNGGSSGASSGFSSGGNAGSSSASGFASGLGAWDPNSPTRWGSSSGGGSVSGSGSGSSMGSSGGAAVCTSSLIDNVNYMTNAVIQDCGRWGFWYAFNPGPTSAIQFPAMGSTFAPSTPGYGMDPGVNGYNGAARTYGTGFNGSNFGAAGMGFDLYDLGNGMKGAYDATRFQYTGVKFYAMLGTTPGAVATMLFRISDKYSDPAAGLCDKTMTSGPTQCYDDATYSVTLSTTWTLITVPFAMLKTVPFGYRQAQAHPMLDPTTIYQMQFAFQPQTNPFAFDVWIDEVSFTP